MSQYLTIETSSSNQLSCGELLWDINNYASCISVFGIHIGFPGSILHVILLNNEEYFDRKKWLPIYSNTCKINTLTCKYNLDPNDTNFYKYLDLV